MDTDEQDAYDLAVLLEDIERTIRHESAATAHDKVRRMFDKARVAGVVRYPQP